MVFASDLVWKKKLLVTSREQTAQLFVSSFPPKQKHSSLVEFPRGTGPNQLDVVLMKSPLPSFFWGLRKLKSSKTKT